MTPRSETDERFMRLALELAREAAAQGDVPVGALLVREDTIVARAGNRAERDGDPAAHAEMLVLRKAASDPLIHRNRGGTLYVTLEPCAMCAGAMVLARLDRVVFGAWDEKAGMAGSVGDLLRHPQLNHRPDVAAGVLLEPCAEVLRDFFSQRRRK